MTYAYLEKLTGSSLLQTTSRALEIYNYASSNSDRMGTDSMSTAERIQFYQRLKAWAGKGELPAEFMKSIKVLESGFSKIQVTMESTGEKGKLVYLYDMNGDRVSLMQLLNNPEAKYKWECDGDRTSTSYFTPEKEGSANLDPKNPNTNKEEKKDTSSSTAEGVSRDAPSGCSSTQTFEASGKTILNSSLFSLNYSSGLFDKHFFGGP